MALIQCKNCGKEISDKALTCPHCGVQLGEKIQEEAQPLICKECRAEIPLGAEACPNCGHPVLQEEPPQKVEVVSVTPPKLRKNAKKGIIAGIVAVVIIAIIAVAIGNSRNKKAVANYGDNLALVAYTMLSGAADAEDAGNLIKSVWYNSIYEKQDATTDKYTRRNVYGPFYDDFNDALSNLFSDSDFSDTISDIKSNQSTVSGLMKTLKNPPAEYEDAYDAVKDCYDAYLVLTNLAISPSGSLQTFSSNFNNADSDMLRAYNALQVYIG
ncbi:MAG: zinc ribbon domain-containing protein [Oscillospiraceae bacterium]|nr:zinc ribbon domain-containing protein [Oscillospiraceae bacterium]